MGNYSESSGSCRVDFFKDTGKWYTTEAVVFTDETWEMHPAEALKKLLREKLGDRLSEMTAVCLEPYVKHSFPVLVRGWTRV